MSGAEALEHYVNEHLAGAASAVRLIGRCREANEGTALGNLQQVEAHDPELAGIDFGALAGRAHEQVRGLEQHRREPAAAAFAHTG